MPESSDRLAWAPADSGDADFARIAAHALDSSQYPALVLEIPSELIVAASPAAALLLDPERWTRNRSPRSSSSPPISPPVDLTSSPAAASTDSKPSEC